ncbi:hypothetical protein E4T56_gene4844, partial [Termitomyces sp. T112]
HDPLARFAQGRRRAANRLFGGQMLGNRQVERRAQQTVARNFRLLDLGKFGAAMDAFEQALGLHPRQVTPDRGGRGIKHRLQFAIGDEAGGRQRFENQPFACGCMHELCRPIPNRLSAPIAFTRNNSLCRQFRAKAIILSTGGQHIPAADHHRRADQQTDAAPHQRAGAHRGAQPFLERKAPERGKQDDAGHMQRPAGEAIFAHLALAHRVEEELAIPQRAAQRRQQPVAQQGRARLGHLVRRAEELPKAAVLHDQISTPQRIGGEPPQQHDAKHRQALRERIGPRRQRQIADRLPRVQTPCETTRHHAREGCDRQTLFQIEFGHSLARGYFARFGRAAARHDDDAHQRDDNAQQGQLPAGLGRNLAHRAVKDRRPQSANDRGQPQRHRHAQRQAQIAHGQTKGEPAKAPHRAPEPAPGQRLTRGGRQHAQQIMASQKTSQFHERMRR